MSNNVIPERSHPPKPLVPLASRSKESSVCPIGKDAVKIEENDQMKHKNNMKNKIINVRNFKNNRTVTVTTSIVIVTVVVQ